MYGLFTGGGLDEVLKRRAKLWKEREKEGKEKTRTTVNSHFIP